MSAVDQEGGGLAEVEVGCSREECILVLVGLVLDAVVDHIGFARTVVGLEEERLAGVHSCFEKIGFELEAGR